jgi:hypothetical protein
LCSCSIRMVRFSDALFRAPSACHFRLQLSRFRFRALSQRMSQHGHRCALARAGGLLSSCFDRRESSIIINLLLLLSLHCFLGFRDTLSLLTRPQGSHAPSRRCLEFLVFLCVRNIRRDEARSSSILYVQRPNAPINRTASAKIHVAGQKNLFLLLRVDVAQGYIVVG